MTRECIRIDSVRGGGACVWCACGARRRTHEAGYGCARALEAMVDGGARQRRRRPLSRYREVAGTRSFARAAVIVCVRAVVCVCVCGVVCVVCGGGDVVVVVVVVVVCVLTRLFAYVYVIGHARDEATSG